LHNRVAPDRLASSSSRIITTQTEGITRPRKTASRRKHRSSHIETLGGKNRKRKTDCRNGSSTPKTQKTTTTDLRERKAKSRSRRLQTTATEIDDKQLAVVQV